MRRRAPLDRGFLLGLLVLAALYLAVSWWRDRDLIAYLPSPDDYGGAADIQRVDADGRTVRLADQRGRWLLVAYVAPWCTDCPSQSRAAQTLNGRELSVLHVVTSSIEGYGHPAQLNDAVGWAQRLGLPNHAVWAADLTEKPLPAIALFDPRGKLRFAHEGSISSEALHMAITRAKQNATEP